MQIQEEHCWEGCYSMPISHDIFGKVRKEHSESLPEVPAAQVFALDKDSNRHPERRGRSGLLLNRTRSTFPSEARTDLVQSHSERT